MGRRAIKFALLLFQAMWLLLVLPGHTRGLISWTSLSGGLQAESHSCCEADEDARTTPDGEPTREQKENCAVCYYAAGLTPAPMPDIFIPDSEPSGILPVLAAPMQPEQTHRLTYYACGPPDCRLTNVSIDARTA